MCWWQSGFHHAASAKGCSAAALVLVAAEWCLRGKLLTKTTERCCHRGTVDCHHSTPLNTTLSPLQKKKREKRINFNWQLLHSNVFQLSIASFIVKFDGDLWSPHSRAYIWEGRRKMHKALIQGRGEKINCNLTLVFADEACFFWVERWTLGSDRAEALLCGVFSVRLCVLRSFEEVLKPCGYTTHDKWRGWADMC